MKMNSLKKAPRKKGASTSTTFRQEDNPPVDGAGLVLDGIADIMEEESQIQFKAKVLVYKVNTDEILVTANQKEVDSVLEKARLNINDIIKTFVELKLYNNDNNLHGNISKVSTNPEGQYLIRVKLEKNKETDDDIAQLIDNQKSAQNDGEYKYMIVRIYPMIYQAYTGDIHVEKAAPQETVLEVGYDTAVRPSPVEQPDDQELATLTEVLKDAGYVVSRKNPRYGELRRYTSFSGVTLTADVTGGGEVVITMRQRGTIRSLIDNVGNTAFSVYQAVLDRGRKKGEWDFGKEVLPNQLTVDADGRITYEAFEDVAVYAKELWHKSRAWTEAGIEVAPEDQQPQDNKPFIHAFMEVRIQYQGDVIVKGVVNDLDYDDEYGRMRLTIGKLKFKNGRTVGKLFDGRAFKGRIMMIHRAPLA